MITDVPALGAVVPLGLFHVERSDGNAVAYIVIFYDFNNHIIKKVMYTRVFNRESANNKREMSLKKSNGVGLRKGKIYNTRLSICT